MSKEKPKYRIVKRSKYGYGDEFVIERRTLFNRWKELKMEEVMYNSVVGGYYIHDKVSRPGGNLEEAEHYLDLYRSYPIKYRNHKIAVGFRGCVPFYLDITNPVYHPIYNPVFYKYGNETLEGLKSIIDRIEDETLNGGKNGVEVIKEYY